MGMLDVHTLPGWGSNDRAGWSPGARGCMCSGGARAGTSPAGRAVTTDRYGRAAVAWCLACAAGILDGGSLLPELVLLVVMHEMLRTILLKQKESLPFLAGSHSKQPGFWGLLFLVFHLISENGSRLALL